MLQLSGQQVGHESEWIGKLSLTEDICNYHSEICLKLWGSTQTFKPDTIHRWCSLNKVIFTISSYSRATIYWILAPKCSAMFSSSQAFSLSCSASTGSDNAPTAGFITHKEMLAPYWFKYKKQTESINICLEPAWAPPTPLQLKVLCSKMSRCAGAARPSLLNQTSDKKTANDLMIHSRSISVLCLLFFC